MYNGRLSVVHRLQHTAVVKQAPTLSLVEHIDTLSDKQRARYIAGLTDKQLLAHKYDWQLTAREKQRPPKGAWFVWFVRAGRGWGKNRAGGGWVQQRAMAGDERRWIALIDKTPADARDDMITGPGGLLRNARPSERPIYNPSTRRLTWPTGAYATIFSGAHPEQPRGFSGDTAWLNEVAAWRYPQETWDNLIFGMREAKVGSPKICVTTTPKPIPIIKAFTKRCEERDTWVLTTGSSYENEDNLDPVYYSEVVRPYEGTVLGQQEIHGHLIEEVEGALWKLAWFQRVKAPPRLVRVIVGVDPQGARRRGSETGIVAVGKGADGDFYLLDDKSCNRTPEGWAQATVACYEDNEANWVVAEKNFGGEMVESTIRAANPDVPVRLVSASRGKDVRAEPVSRLYERGQVWHVGTFADLESECCTWVPGESSQPSPNRMDALVWAITELMGGKRTDISVGPIGVSRASPWRIGGGELGSSWRIG